MSLDLTYYSDIESLKTFFAKNYSDLYSAFILVNRLEDKLELVVISENKSFKNKIINYFEKENISCELIFYELKDYKKQIETKSLSLENAFDYCVNSFFICGISITNELLVYMQTNFINENINFNNIIIPVKDLKITITKSVGGIIKNKTNNKLLALRYAFGDKYWNALKGKIEEGESDELALKRETFEETGIKEIDVLNKSIISFYNYYSNHFQDIRKVYVTYYLVETKEDAVKLSEEHSEYKWISYEEIDAIITYPSAQYIYKELGK